MRTLLSLVFGGIIYYLSAIYGMSVFSFQPSNITILWLPFAIGTVLFHHFGTKVFPFIFMGSFCANFPGMDNGSLPATAFYTFIAAGADTFASFLSARLLKKYVDYRFNSIKGFLPFSLYGVIIPTFISSVIISLNLYWGGYITQQKILTYIVLLMFADGLGLFLIYPIYKNFSKTIPSLSELKQIFTISMIIFLTIYFSFEFHFLIFIFTILAVIMAFRIREDIVATILLIAIIELIGLSATDLTIFSSNNENDSLLMLISFISSLVFIILGITQHQKDLIKHRYFSITDVLTHTHNRFFYKETIEGFIREYHVNSIPFSMLLFDIDNFKSVNDTYGHLVGDHVLADISSLVQDHIRESDSLFRIGGEEFVVLFPNTTLKKSIDIAEKLRKLIGENLNTISNRTITVSMGITEMKKSDTEDSMYRRVDELLYISKQNGKNMMTSDLYRQI